MRPKSIQLVVDLTRCVGSSLLSTCRNFHVYTDIGLLSLQLVACVWPGAQGLTVAKSSPSRAKTVWVLNATGHGNNHFILRKKLFLPLCVGV